MGRRGRNVILCILILALILRVAIAIVSSPYIDRLYDVESFKLYGQAISAGENPYITVGGRSNYPPLWPLAMGGIASIVGTGQVFVILYKLLIIAADLGIILLLFRMVKHPWNAWAALIYAIHPASLLITGVQGQFDSIAALCILATIFILEQRRRVFRAMANGDLAALVLGIGILVKIYPVFILPLLLLKAERRWRSLILASLPTALFFLPFVLSVEGIRAVITNVLGYSGGFGEWGLGLLTTAAVPGSSVVAFLAAWGKLLVIGMMLLSAWLFRTRPFREGVIMILLAFLVFTQGFGIQYYAWLLPFTLFSLDWRAAAYLAGTALSAIGFFGANLLKYWTLPFLAAGSLHALDIGMRVLIWIACVVWWGISVRRVSTHG